MRFNGLVPMLQTDDMKRTRDWDESLLGFRCVSADGDDWCRLIRDDVAIMFMHNDHLGPPHATATQYIYVDDVMAIWDSIRIDARQHGGRKRCPMGC
jgi:hypothetical protein